MEEAVAFSRSAEENHLSVRLRRVRATAIEGSSPHPDAHSSHPSVVGSPSMATEAPFGIVHLGERFTSFLSISNESSLLAFDSIMIKVELQTSSQRQLIREDTEERAITLRPEESSSLSIQHDIREIGAHILVISVSYLNPQTHERKFLRKFFKFTVASPLALKTKVTELMGRDVMLLEAHVHNTSNTNFTLENLCFEPVSPLTVTCLSYEDHDEEGDVDELSKLAEGLSVSGRATPDIIKAEFTNHELSIDSIYQFVFILTSPTISSFHLPLQLGRLEIRWRTESGEQGRLQTGTLSHPAPSSADPACGISAYIKRVPQHITRFQPFEALFVFKNSTEEPVQNVCLDFAYESGPVGPVAPFGICQLRLGTLTALNTTRAGMMLMPLQTGLVASENFWLCYEDAQGEAHRKPYVFQLFVEDAGRTGFVASEYYGSDLPLHSPIITSPEHASCRLIESQLDRSSPVSSRTRWCGQEGEQ